MADSVHKWKYLSIGLMGLLGSTGILVIIPNSEAAVPELRGSLLEKILFSIETTHGVVHLDFPNYDISSGGFTIQSVLDEGKAMITEKYCEVCSAPENFDRLQAWYKKF